MMIQWSGARAPLHLREVKDMIKKRILYWILEEETERTIAVFFNEDEAQEYIKKVTVNCFYRITEER